MKIATKHFERWFKKNGAGFIMRNIKTNDLESYVETSKLYKKIAKKAYIAGLHEGVLLMCEAKEKA